MFVRFYIYITRTRISFHSQSLMLFYAVECVSVLFLYFFFSRSIQFLHPYVDVDAHFCTLHEKKIEHVYFI